MSRKAKTGLRVLICGGRQYTEIIDVWNIMKIIVQEYGQPALVIHGDAKGADKLGGRVAAMLKIPVQVFPADWDRHGKKAGRLRNIRMAVEAQPDLILAFHMDIEASKGTKHMLEVAREHGIPYILYPDMVDWNMDKLIPVAREHQERQQARSRDGTMPVGVGESPTGSGLGTPR